MATTLCTPEQLTVSTTNSGPLRYSCNSTALFSSWKTLGFERIASNACWASCNDRTRHTRSDAADWVGFRTRHGAISRSSSCMSPSWCAWRVIWWRFTNSCLTSFHSEVSSWEGARSPAWERAWASKYLSRRALTTEFPPMINDGEILEHFSHLENPWEKTCVELPLVFEVKLESWSHVSTPDSLPGKSALMYSLCSREILSISLASSGAYDVCALHPDDVLVGLIIHNRCVLAVLKTVLSIWASQMCSDNAPMTLIPRRASSTTSIAPTFTIQHAAS